MNYEEMPDIYSTSESQKPKGPHEWINDKQLKLLDFIDEATLRLAEMEESGDSERFRVARSLEIAQSRIANLNVLRGIMEEKGLGKSALEAVEALYEDQREEISKVITASETMAKYTTDIQQHGIDSIGQQVVGATEETGEFVNFLHEHLDKA